MAEADSPVKSLKTIFEEAVRNFEEYSSNSVPSQELQHKIKKTIELLEESTKLINIAAIYSNNELIDEVSTECIQYLAIPAMLGELVGQLQNGDRFSNLEVSEIYYKDFLKRAQEYGLIPDNTNKNSEAGDEDQVKRQVLSRNDKIRKYEEQKQLLADIVLLKKNLEWAEDEVRRKYFTSFVKSFIYKAEEELRSIEMEKPLAAMRKSKPEKKRPAMPPPPPLKPVIITKNELQKKVFGMGYPSLPTMTVDEFYEERVREGIFPTGGSNHAKALQDMVDPEVVKDMDETEEEEKERLEETDDAEALQRARNTDEFKDTHRRGWGNRYNRS